MRTTIRKLFLPLLILSLLAALCACGEGSTVTTADATVESTAGKTEHVHSYGEWANVEPSCTATGMRARFCECGDVQSETIPALGHTETPLEGTAATCTEAGLTEGKKCSVCGEILLAQTVIDPLGHEDADGDGKCDRCDVDVVTACEHAYESVVTEPTCTADGYTTYTCGKCGHSYVSDTVAATGHAPEVRDARDVTCTEDGYTGDRYCSVCEEKLAGGEVIAAPGHTEEVLAGKEPTETEDGLTDGKKCSVCGEILVEQTVIPATGDEGVDYGYLYLEGEYDITIWVPDYDGATEHIAAQIAEFQKKYPYLHINVRLEGVSDYNVVERINEDLSSAADIYCFSQDQLQRLVQCGALSALSGANAETVAAANCAAAVSAASAADTLLAYPMDASNGYYMYYDKSIFSEEDVEDLATLVNICEAKGLKFRFSLENAWYNAAFFYATGCYSNWIMDESGRWIAIEDTYNSENGLIAMKGMQILTHSSAYDSDADIFSDAAVIVTGTWNADAAAAHFGEDLGATDLPSFTVDGESYHLASYFGCRLMGVKPQIDSKKENVLHLLAGFLTNEENQLDNYNSYGWAPSNLAAQANSALLSDITLQALFKQDEYAVTQGSIHESWWDIAKLLGADARSATGEWELKAALEDYEESICAVLEKSENERNTWGIIGGICGSWWDTDFPMYEQDDGSFLSERMFLNEGEQFKIRQGHSWNVNYGVNGELNGNNFVIELSGYYRIRLYFDGDRAIIELLYW